MERKEIEVLDHGFIRVVDWMGDDNRIVDAARVSYGVGTKPVRQNAALIKYLMRHGHTSPFEQCELQLHLKMPLFVARQWLRHRTANVNEYSARYSILEDQFYIPDAAHIAQQATSNNQGRSEEAAPADLASFVQTHFLHTSKQAYSAYEAMLQRGVAREIARMVLPVNIYTQFYWKIDLHNLLHFLKVRADDHAQYEIRAYASKMLELVREWVPMTYAAFMEYSMHGKQLSQSAYQALQGATEKPPVRTDWDMSQREWQEMVEPLLHKNSS